MAAFADTSFPVPVPRPTPAISARETFFDLVLFTALGAFAFSLVSLLFGILEHRLPDRVEWFVVVTPEDSIRWSIARICVALPLFLFMSHRIAAITSTATVALAEADPETHAPYEYQRQSNDQCQLCAAFTQDNPTGTNDDQAGRNDPRRWQHASGRQCFTLHPRLIERPPGG